MSNEEIERIPVCPGAYRIRYQQPTNPNNRTIHVIGFVDGEYLICRTWFTHKRRWHYFVETKFYLQLLLDSKVAKLVKRDWRPDQKVWSEGYSYPQ